MPDATKAIAIRRDDGRFYCGISKTGRLQTAWSLAGATLFQLGRETEIFQAELQFCKRGQNPHRVVVRLEVE